MEARERARKSTKLSVYMCDRFYVCVCVGACECVCDLLSIFCKVCGCICAYICIYICINVYIKKYICIHGRAAILAN